MIEASALTKTFNTLQALSGIDLALPKGSILGLIGSNGAGKSTFLRLLAGIYRPESGGLTLGGENPYENPRVKSTLFFIPDTLYFSPGMTLGGLRRQYAPLYPSWDEAFFTRLYTEFQLENKKRLRTMSKGMQRQALLCCALATRPAYLLLDEVFDGLDLLVRKKLRGLLAAEVADRGMTVVICTHNLRELEDICDRLVLLHKGKIRLVTEPDELRETIQRFQAVFSHSVPDHLGENLDIIALQTSGLMVTLTARGDRAEIQTQLQQLGAYSCEQIPLSLEELFISEMEAAGYELS